MTDQQPPRPPPLSRRAVRIGGTAVVVALLLFLLIGLLPRRSQQERLRKHAREIAHNDSIPEVMVVSVHHGQPIAELSLPGTIEGMHETPIYARASGYVRRWMADIGQRVRAGQLLAIIDAPDLDQQLVQARAQKAQARSVLAYARSTLLRWQVLYRDSVVTRLELDQKQAQYDADLATYIAAQAGVTRLETLVSYDRVTAPFSGVVIARNVDEGVLVTGNGGASATNPASLGGATIPAPAPGQATSAGATSTSNNTSSDPGAVSTSALPSAGSSASPTASSVGGTGGSLFRVVRYDTVRMYIGVPQAYAVDVQPGLDANVRVREIAGRTFHGRVTRTADAIDAASRTLLTAVDVVNPDRVLLPGMFAQTNLRIDRATAPVILPAGALIVRTQGPQAAVVGADSVVHLRSLDIDRDLGAALEIDSGLADGDIVVINTPDDLRDGQRVRPRPEPSRGTATGQSALRRPANPLPSDSEGEGHGRP